MIREYLKRLLKAASVNINGYYCPKCSLLMESKATTALAHVMYDEKYHKPKTYIKCSECGLTTPAYESYKDLIDAWDDYFIKQEADLFERD